MFNGALCRPDPPHREPAKSICDGLGRQRSRSRNDIALVDMPTAPDKFLCKLASEFFAARCLRRLALKEWPTQNVADDPVEHSAGGSDSPIAIVGLAKQTLGDGVNDHIAWASVESQHLIGGESWQIGARI